MIDFDKVETIFDHGITMQEMDDVFGYTATEEEYKKFLRNHYQSDESLILALDVSLYLLYYSRGDNKTAMKYADRIPDSDWKWFELLNHDH